MNTRRPPAVPRDKRRLTAGQYALDALLDREPEPPNRGAVGRIGYSENLRVYSKPAREVPSDD